MVCSNCKLIKKKHKFVLNEYKLWIKQQHIVKIFYMWMLCITLKERNTKRIVQNWHLSKSPSKEWSWFFYRISHFCFICCAVGSLQYSKCVWSKVGVPTVHIFIRCILMSQRNQKWKKVANHFYTVFKVFNLDRTVGFKC